MDIVSSVLSILLGLLSVVIALYLGNIDRKVKCREIINKYNSLDFLYILLIFELKKNDSEGIKYLLKKISESFLELLDLVNMFSISYKPNRLDDSKVMDDVLMTTVNIKNFSKKYAVANEYIVEFLRKNNIFVLKNSLDYHKYKIKFKRNFFCVIVGAKMFALKNIKEKN